MIRSGSGHISDHGRRYHFGSTAQSAPRLRGGCQGAVSRATQGGLKLLLAVGHYRELGNIFDAERKPNAYGESSELQRYPVRAVPAGLVRIERQVDAIEALELL